MLEKLKMTVGLLSKICYNKLEGIALWMNHLCYKTVASTGTEKRT